LQVTSYGKLRVVIHKNPAIYFLTVLVLAGSIALSVKLGKAAEIVVERDVTGHGTITITRSNLLGSTDTHTFELSRVQSIEICRGGPTTIVESVREHRGIIFCSLAVLLVDSAAVEVGSWEPYPFQNTAHVAAARDSLMSFIESRLPGTVRQRVGGFAGAMAVGLFAFFFLFIHLRLLCITRLDLSVRAEAAGASVLTRLRRPGFQVAEKQVHYVPMGWVTAVRCGQTGGILVEYSNGPEVRIPLPEMPERQRVKIRLFLEDIIMTHVRTAKKD